MDRKDYFELEQRREYAESIARLLEKRSAERETDRYNYLLKTDKEKLRREYIGMLGWPLNDKSLRRGKINAVTEKLPDFNGMSCVRYKLEVMPDFWFYGILYEPLSCAAKAFAIAQHGGLGSPEVAGGLIFDSANYNYMVERVVKRGITVFAPQLLLWNCETYGTPYDRVKTDITLKQLGGSVTALEVFCISRSLDYFISVGYAATGHIGMIGLSYGGMYALAAAAADTRICATVSSCFFNDRIQYNWQDWSYFNQSRSFLDAETAVLILPRRLYIECGESDGLFSAQAAQVEIRRLHQYAEHFNYAGSLKARIFSGGHELDKSDENIDFLADAICP